MVIRCWVDRPSSARAQALTIASEIDGHWDLNVILADEEGLAAVGTHELKGSSLTRTGGLSSLLSLSLLHSTLLADVHTNHK